MTGLIIFCRSVLFYYSAGVALGLIATLVLIILLCKRLMGVRPFLLLLSGSWSVSLLVIYFGVLNLAQILTKYRYYALGYLCVVGCFSFAVCYKHGPLSNEHNINLLTWILKLIGSVLVYSGVTLPQFAYAVLITLFCINNLHHPANLVHSVYRKLKGSAKKAANRFITEDEYREQTEAVTLIALENLRKYCRGQEFPAWETVMKMSSPKRLADFILKGQHLTQEEVSVHEDQYGIGGSFLEAQLFATEENSRSGSENWEDPNEEEETDETQTIDFSTLVIEQLF
uniref:Transmembrane protein 194A n=1 Tax=Callorhinchus milii TaxID=7868 RepID=V9KV60_CALMI